MSDKVMAYFYLDSDNKERVKRLAKKTGHSASFFYNLLVERYLDELEGAFLAGKDLKDEHMDHIDSHRRRNGK